MLLNDKKKEVKSLEEAAQKLGSGLAERLAYYDKELDDIEEPWRSLSERDGTLLAGDGYLPEGEVWQQDALEKLKRKLYPMRERETESFQL